MLPSIVLIILGLALAFAGQRFLWLMIGLAGFVAGYNLVAVIIPSQSDAFQLIVGLIAGLIGAGLARKFTDILLLFAGFVLVGNLLLRIGAVLEVEGWLWQLLLFGAGGLIGLALVRYAFSWALVVISALGGASLVMQGIPGLFNREMEAVTLIAGAAVVIAGLLVQVGILQAGGKPASPSPHSS